MIDNEEIMRKVIAKGQREMTGYCHCGKLRQRHSNVEGLRCRKTRETETVVTKMSEKDIKDMDLRKV